MVIYFGLSVSTKVNRDLICDRRGAMDFLLPTLSIEAVEVSNAAELSFESNNSDLQFGIVLESDEELNASSTILPGLKTVLVGDENVTSSKYREKEVSLTKFSSDVVLESEEEHDDDTMLTGLQTVLTGLSFTFCEDLAVRNCKQQSKSISLETTIPPITEQCLKQQMIFCAQTTNESCSNATITLYVGSGGSFCKLKTNVNDADSYGNYWCPFPNCCKKSRKRFILKDHMKKTHHGPFYCKLCGVYFLQLPSLHRHFRQWGHSRQNYLVPIPKETVRRHTIAAVEFFSVRLHEAFAASSDYLILN